MSKRTPEITNPGEVYWFRQKGESRQAYAAFQVYRDMGKARTTFKVADKVGKHHSLMRRWCTRWHWVDRADAFDTNEEFELLTAEREERIKMRREDAKIARRVKDKVAERLETINVNQLSPNVLIRWFKVAVEVERLSLGEATGIIQQQVAQARDELSKAVEDDPELAEEFARILQQTRPSED